MKIAAIPLFLMTIMSAPAVLCAQVVAERYGNISYTSADGITRALTREGNFGDPVLSPDRRTVAFIHRDASKEDGVFTSLWIADGPTAKARRLIGASPNDAPERNFASFERPIFSLDGGFVYVSADAWVTSTAVHQVSLKTGKEHFVTDGWLNGIIRTGPWRGYLLVGRHMYHPAPRYGSYNPVYVVRPDGKQRFIVPGSDKDEGEKSVDRWLARNGWKSW